MECLTLEEVKSILKLKKTQLYELFRSKDFPSFKVGGSWRVTKTDLESWIEEQKKGA